MYRRLFVFDYQAKDIDSYKTTYKKLKEEFIGNIHKATFEIKCSPTFGHTIGNSLRRTLLTYIKGSAPVAVHIEGTNHEYSTVPGIKELVIHIVSNLKEIAVKTNDFVKLRVQKEEAGLIKAGDFEIPEFAQIMNPDLHICTLDLNAKIDMSVAIAIGAGYVTSEEHKFNPSLPEGFFPVDSVFSPIISCNYTVSSSTSSFEPYDTITLTIETNGVKSAEEALLEAVDQINSKITPLTNGTSKEKKVVEEEKTINKLSEEFLNTTISELEDILSVAIVRRLTENNIYSLGQLLTYTPDEIGEIPRMGKASLNRIIDFLSSHNVYLGMLRGKEEEVRRISGEINKDNHKISEENYFSFKNEINEENI